MLGVRAEPSTELIRTSPETQSERLVRYASFASVAVALTLIVIKLAAWWVSGAVSILASMADSALDFVASFITLVAIRVAQLPADENHRLGHGKAEALAGFVQSLLIAGSSVYLIATGIDRTSTPQTLARSDLAFFVMTSSVVITIGLNIFQFYVVRVSQSLAIRADATHYMVDLVTTSAILLVLALPHYPVLDGVVATGIGAFVFVTAVSIARRAIHMLMDTELDQEERDRIRNAVQRTPGVIDTANMRSWRSGSTTIVLLDVIVQDGTTVRDATKVLSDVESSLRDLDANVNATLVPVDVAFSPLTPTRERYRQG